MVETESELDVDRDRDLFRGEFGSSSLRFRPSSVSAAVIRFGLLGYIRVYTDI